ncbi:MAG: S41 family peptidase, partial [Pyrinomonadaceae bacterium]
ASHFITWKLSFKYKEFLAKSFAEIKEKGARNLIIDIRDNGGGDSEAPIEILRYVAKKNFPCSTSIKTYIKTVRADAALFNYFETYDKELQEALRNGIPRELYKRSDSGQIEFLGNSKDCQPHKPLEKGFKGKTYLLVNSANASAAFTMAQTAKRNRLATLVGQVTGGNKRGFNGGSYLFIYLPNSRFEFDMPFFAYIDESPQEDAGIDPDILIRQKPEDVGNNFDGELAEVRKLLQRDNISGLRP